MKAAILILIISFIADQLFQIKSVRQTKHKDSMSLLLHVAMWSIVMFALMSVMLLKGADQDIIAWWFIVTVIHYAVEWCCLRMWTHFYYDKKRSLMAFWIILEQLILNVSMLWLFDFLVM